jgi:hypothetical protein
MEQVCKLYVLNAKFHQLNRKCTKPSKPHLTIQIAQSNLPEDAPVEPIPILAARFNSDGLKQILVTYGDTFNLRFENVVSILFVLKSFRYYLVNWRINIKKINLGLLGYNN